MYLSGCKVPIFTEEARNMKAQERLCISVEEMGKRMSISRATAFALVKQKGFPAISLGRRILIPVASLEKWLDAQAASQMTVNPTGRLE
jgi:excisionase family DNA binding protein